MGGQGVSGDVRSSGGERVGEGRLGDVVHGGGRGGGGMFDIVKGLFFMFQCLALHFPHPDLGVESSFDLL